MIRHNTPLIPSLVVGICLFRAAGVATTAHAADPTGNPPATSAGASTSGEPPADVQKAMTQIGDLDLLITLTPLHLNVAQIDKTVALLNSIKQDSADTARVNYAALRAIADDVDKTRTAALQGTSPDPDVKAKVGKVIDAIQKRASDANAASAKRVATFLEATLTPEQIKLIETDYAGWMGGKITVPAQYKDDPDDRKAYVQQTSLGAYASRILLNQRAIDLLQKMRASAPPEPTAPPAATPATTNAPAAGAATAPPAPAPPAPFVAP